MKKPTKRKAPKKPPTKAKASPAKGKKSDDRAPNGQLLPGHGIPGPGRPSLPDWFDDVGETALKKLRDVVRGHNDEGEPVIMCDELKLRAYQVAAAYRYGKPGKAKVSGSLPTTKEDRIKLLEDNLLELALSGDSIATLKMLAALMPEKYGDTVPPPLDPKKNDTVDWVPHLPPEPVLS